MHTIQGGGQLCPALAGAGGEHRPTEGSGARTPALASVTQAPKALSSPNFSVCTCEWRECLLKVISGRQKHWESTGGQEGTRAHPGASAASPSRMTHPPLLCPPTHPALGLLSFHPGSSYARASSGAPGRACLLLSSSARFQHAVSSPTHPSRPCSWVEAT